LRAAEGDSTEGDDVRSATLPRLIRHRLFLVLAVFAVATAGLFAASRSRAEVAQKGGLRVSVSGDLSPRKLPRKGKVPVAVSFNGRIKGVNGEEPPQLLSLKVALNRRGTLTYRGIPKCRMKHINPSTTAEAIAACRSSLVGTGRFSANVRFPEQSPFPSVGKVLAFNGRFKGRPAILAHIYGTEPVPTSYVLPFVLARTGGEYGTTLEASFPRVTGEWGFVTGISMKLDRRFRSGGKTHSYLAADCPAAKGFPGAVFPLAKASFVFEGGKTLSPVMNRSCKVRK